MQQKSVPVALFVLLTEQTMHNAAVFLNYSNGIPYLPLGKTNGTIQNERELNQKGSSNTLTLCSLV